MTAPEPDEWDYAVSESQCEELRELGWQVGESMTLVVRGNFDHHVEVWPCCYRSAPTDTKAPEPRGFIMCTVEQAGGFALWWRPDGKGYTSDLDKAGLYTESDARRRTSRDLFVPDWKAKRSTRRVVDARTMLRREATP